MKNNTDEKMKAVICEKYGSIDHLKVKKVNKPIPKPNEVLIKIYSTTVTSGDAKLRSANFPLLFWLPMRLAMGFGKPRNAILGSELVGKIEKIGNNVTKFKKGDIVFGSAGTGLGAHAEYICLQENAVLIKNTHSSHPY